MSVKVIKIKILRVSTHKIQIIILHLGKAQSYFFAYYYQSQPKLELN